MLRPNDLVSFTESNTEVPLMSDSYENRSHAISWWSTSSTPLFVLVTAFVLIILRVLLAKGSRRKLFSQQNMIIDDRFLKEREGNEKIINNGR